MKKKKKVLIITYYWPPAGGSGIQRILKFTKYLPKFDWQPVILTVKKGDYPATDDSLKDEVPKNIPVYKYPIWEPYNIYRKIIGKNKNENIPVGILAQNQNLGIRSRIMHFIRANFFIPDARIGWYFTAVKAANRIIKSHNIDLILVTSPPHSLQLIGMKLKKKLSVPLISDFRDPWTDIHYYQNISRLKISQIVDSYLEKKVLNSCDKLLTVSPALKRLFKSKVDHLDSEVIYNGFDNEDFFKYENISDKKYFRISYIGNFLANQNINLLWTILHELINENTEFANKLKLHFTGKVNSDVKHSISEYDLLKYTKFEKYVPHNLAIKRMREASVLLFIIPQTPKNSGILTGKIFDYLGSKTPFLSIGPKGDAEKLLHQVDAGPMFRYHQKTEIKSYIKNLFGLWQNDDLGSLSPDFAKIQKFDRKSQTKKLSQTFNKIFKKRYF